jgi:CheY-like chemotaxis protein
VTEAALNVLLIEDDVVDVMSVRRAFAARQAPFTLTVASDGRQGLARLRGDEGHAPLARPYFVVLDLNLPVMSGLEFLRELRVDPQHRSALVFVLTTSDAETDRSGAYEHNIAGYIVKSSLGHDLGPLVDLLEGYRRLVRFP